jgi:hypothetical protein
MNLKIQPETAELYWRAYTGVHDSGNQRHHLEIFAFLNYLSNFVDSKARSALPFCFNTVMFPDLATG